MRAARRRRWAAAVGMLLLGSCARIPAGGALPNEPLRVMTFNIRYGTAADGEHAWPLRREPVVQVIRDFDPDLLGLQEALRFQLDELRAAFPEYAEVGVGRDDGRTAGEYAAILYDVRRLELLAQGHFWLSDTPAEPGSMSWGNHVPRIVTWARFRDRVTGRALYAFNTHWDHESQSARERSAALLLQRIAERSHPADPVIISADFNSGEGNPALRTLLAAAVAPGGRPFRDSFRVLHPDARVVGTFNDFQADSTGEKIDAVLVSGGWDVVAAEIMRVAPGGRLPSDHYPVTAVLRGSRDE